MKETTTDFVKWFDSVWEGTEDTLALITLSLLYDTLVYNNYEDVIDQDIF